MLRTFVRPVVVGLASASVLAVPSIPAQAASSSDKYESDVAKYVNTERTKQKRVKLSGSSCLDRYAETQARRMADAKKIFHQDLGPILGACKMRLVGENVAVGYTSGKAVTAGWMASSGHRAIILNKDYRLRASGAVKGSDGRWYVSMVFGRKA